jgi:hypothetical protein
VIPIRSDPIFKSRRCSGARYDPQPPLLVHARHVLETIPVARRACLVPPCMILLEISALAAGCRLLELALELGLLLLASSVAVFPLAFTHVVHKRGCRGGRLASARPRVPNTDTDRQIHTPCVLHPLVSASLRISLFLRAGKSSLISRNMFRLLVFFHCTIILRCSNHAMPSNLELQSLDTNSEPLTSHAFVEFTCNFRYC